ncbi:pentapeptide repeat-containing protein [Archangium violaceum]|uniref:pentapeptide repeat-containing protein n=1 Tax=Archangium violaceum TaxID=83451 RepID=UPI002B28F9FA|nr:pentapeptide repeat-containing protein [Archangium gephyra]
MDWLGNVVFENREIENERLELTDREANYILGLNLTLKNCTLVLKVPARCLSLKQARFIDCTFEVKQELKNAQGWLAASLKDCRFKGRLSGCDFGHWPEYSNLPWYQHGSIEDCDFSEARLDGCRFHGCDPRTMRFPKWPCFTILDPIGHSRELNSVEWPGSSNILVKNFYKWPPSTVALTDHAPTIAKQFDTTPEELRAVIEQFDFIVR